jgi:hypothetical protein
VCITRHARDRRVRQTRATCHSSIDGDVLCSPPHPAPAYAPPPQQTLSQPPSSQGAPPRLSPIAPPRPPRSSRPAASGPRVAANGQRPTVNGQRSTVTPTVSGPRGAASHTWHTMAHKGHRPRRRGHHNHHHHHIETPAHLVLDIRLGERHIENLRRLRWWWRCPPQRATHTDSAVARTAHSPATSRSCCSSRNKDRVPARWRRSQGSASLCGGRPMRRGRLLGLVGSVPAHP